METTKIGDVTFIHHSDLSGDIEIHDSHGNSSTVTKQQVTRLLTSHIKEKIVLLTEDAVYNENLDDQTLLNWYFDLKRFNKSLNGNGER